MKILIAEDEKMTLKMLSMKLQKDGYEVIQAEDGGVAMDYLEKNACPDLVITDIMMPFYSGLEVVEKIRKDLKSKIPIIVLSAMGQEDSVEEAFKLGADDYITKPFSPIELSSRVKRLFNA
ncbi:response regulator transcription factor [Labilibaculum sp. K2S]|uniref:response regulator transcription factor n=1 Tax=Labilibaculum sp. K2S TaxID=3056386 RepID=UPI0025A4010F|nr:response regulator transcription factor [Labilibaculum sp. K2S]MDM8161847.1 response regulator transcription factor [Labilibaculum sp. K2S]